MNEDDISTIGNEEPPPLSTFQELYRPLLFLICLFLAGDVVCGRILKIVPPLVGQIIVGIVFGPYCCGQPEKDGWAATIAPSSRRTWQILGEIGLVLLLVQAGLEMDLRTLRSVGPRGGAMAVTGSVLPTSIGFLISRAVLHLPPATAIAAGCSFGPTSAGIAMNVLGQCGVLRSRVGQLIVAIAIVDDMFALVVLSQLRALTGRGGGAGGVTASSVAVPIASALLWLGVGGYAALYVMPGVFRRVEQMKTFLKTKTGENAYSYSDRRHGMPSEDQDQDQGIDDGDEVEQQETTINNGHSSHSSSASPSLWHVGILLFALLPATYYSRASYFLGAFLAGLSACQEPGTANAYNEQLAQIIRWLMRIFFGASIAFEIPILLFDDPVVICHGFLLSLSLLGKVMTGFLLTPIPSSENGGGDRQGEGGDGGGRAPPPRRRWDRHHLRDCAVVGFSMAGEAEFAFLVASFGLEEGLLTEQLYASVVFAILLSTIIGPVLLRTTLALFPIPQVGEGLEKSSMDRGTDGGDILELDEPSSSSNVDTATKGTQNESRNFK